jgi:2-oxoacid:acceptor oxidoreductase delta subunit (pyruvate/2-ketoisovalerate family)
MMKQQSKKMFDASTVPDDYCPIAVDFFDMQVGDWRAKRPVVLRSKCVKCGTCWAFCPTQCIIEKPKWFEANLKICKGCGICAQECPNHAITMVEEQEE